MDLDQWEEPEPTHFWKILIAVVAIAWLSCVVLAAHGYSVDLKALLQR